MGTRLALVVLGQALAKTGGEEGGGWAHILLRGIIIFSHAI